jgi:hypothetical protein
MLPNTHIYYPILKMFGNNFSNCTPSDDSELKRNTLPSNIELIKRLCCLQVQTIHCTVQNGKHKDGRSHPFIEATIMLLPGRRPEGRVNHSNSNHVYQLHDRLHRSHQTLALHTRLTHIYTPSRSGTVCLNK